METRSTNFDKAIRFTLRWEGGYVNDPNDSGGETKFGITKATLDSAYIQGIVDHNSVRHLKRAEAEQIYFEFYWQGAHCDLLKYPLCLAHFDCAVNCGRVSANKILQRVVNTCTYSHLTVDGIIGPKTKAAILNIQSADGATVFYNNLRRERYKAIVKNKPKNTRYLRGWLRRVDDLQRLIFIS